MKVHEFLSHHGIAKNPFAEEDAQTDPVFKDGCIDTTYHPAWDKIFGDPREPATSIVFGEKGAGKTAMRLQIARHLQRHNRTHSRERLFVIHYDDFNPFLDRFMNRLPARRRKVERALAGWKLWDHMDAILCLGVTDLVDRVLDRRSDDGSSPQDTEKLDLNRLDLHQRRDLLLLAACYDQSTSQPFKNRWNRLRQAMGFWALKARLALTIGWLVTALLLAAVIWLFMAANNQTAGQATRDLWQNTPWWVYALILLLGWLPWLWKAGSRWMLAHSIVRSTRVGARQANQLRKSLMYFTASELAGQPLPNKNRTDDRYELLTKFQGILRSLGFQGVFVLVDRVDEPYAINGSADLMRLLIWPMLDNKFLKNQGIGVKLMLPSELKYFIEREDRDFQQRARLDKQNLVPSLAWTGEALFDVANARLRACAEDGRQPSVRDLFTEDISQERLIDGFRALRVPRHLHKFLYHLLVAHCNAHTDEAPQWQIPRERFESELALYQREIDAGRT